MNGEVLIDFQFIRNVIIGIVLIVKSYYCRQLLSLSVTASF
jgi:hypothetical protein